MKASPRLGILPLYLAMYDDVDPQYREEVEGFARQVAKRLTSSGIEVVLGPAARVRDEVKATLAELTSHNVDAVATLHLAYAPSLEAADALEALELPLILLDTTPSPTFGTDATMDDMLHNHGIHGVQDLASVLRRRGRPFSLAVGHISDDSFVEEVLQFAQAARAVQALHSMHVVVVGDEFTGMGDFAVTPQVMKEVLGIAVQRVPVSTLRDHVEQVTEAECRAETADDQECFDCTELSAESLLVTNRVGLGLRRMLKETGSDAFSFNFQSFNRGAGIRTVPFLEASKAMARGVGYAGEGDGLTAALVGALLQGFGGTTFAEMFCPDWTEGSLFMSHMGECNPELASSRPKLVEKHYTFTEVENPVIALFPLRPGAATLVNLAPGPEHSFSLIVARVRVLDRELQPGFPDVPHFWIQPTDSNLPGFLSRYSQCGGTHHLALVTGDHLEALSSLATMLGISFVQV